MEHAYALASLVACPLNLYYTRPGNIDDRKYHLFFASALAFAARGQQVEAHSCNTWGTWEIVPGKPYHLPVSLMLNLCPKSVQSGNGQQDSGPFSVKPIPLAWLDQALRSWVDAPEAVYFWKRWPQCVLASQRSKIRRSLSGQR